MLDLPGVNHMKKHAKSQGSKRVSGSKSRIVAVWRDIVESSLKMQRNQLRDAF